MNPPPQTLGTPQSVPPSLRVWVREGALPLMAVDGIRGMSPFHWFCCWVYKLGSYPRQSGTKRSAIEVMSPYCLEMLMVLSRITINSLIEREYMAATERLLFTLNKGNYLVLSKKHMIHLQIRSTETLHWFYYFYTRNCLTKRFREIVGLLQSFNKLVDILL